MKKVLLLSLIAVLGLYSCNKTEITNIEAGEMSFRVSVSNATGTKGMPAKLGELGMFNVIAAASTGTDTIYLYKENADCYNAKTTLLTDEAGDVDYVDAGAAAYWPAGENTTVDFFAISPAVSESNFESFSHVNVGNDKDKGALRPEFDITIPYSSDNQQDYMVARTNGKKRSDGSVLLQFKHILSQIEFKAQVTSPVLRVDISEVIIESLAMSANCKFTSTSDNTHAPVFKLGALSNTHNAFKCVVTEEDGVVSSTTTNSFGFLLPQTLTAWSGTDNVSTGGSYLKIKAKIYNTALDHLVNDIPNVNVMHDGYVYIPFSATWEMGKKYVYTLNFGSSAGVGGGGGLDENGDPILSAELRIDYSVSVEDWQEVSNDIDLAN